MFFIRIILKKIGILIRLILLILRIINLSISFRRTIYKFELLMNLIVVIVQNIGVLAYFIAYMSFAC